MFRDLSDTLILVAHVKDRQISIDGQEMSEMTLDLTGKLGDILCGEADAVGYVYRKKMKLLFHLKVVRITYEKQELNTYVVEK